MNAERKILLGVASALVLLVTALAIARPRYEVTWHGLVPNGAPVAAQTGDRIIIRPLIAGTLTITAYPFTVAQISAAPKRPADFRSEGTDTYELSDDGEGALDVTLLALRPAIAPLLVAFLLLLATIGAFWALSQLSGHAKLTLQCEPLILALVALSSFALCLLVPRYIHNDTFGGGLRWGYLGWGYVDTVAAIPRALTSGGLTGLANVPSGAKPILYPLFASLFTVFASPLSVAIVMSAFMSALATAGIVQLGSMLLDRWTGLFAAALFAFAPVTLAYATAFYAETAFLAGLLWAAIFIINGVRLASRSSLLVGGVIGSLAVATKTLDAVVLYAVALFLLILAARITWKTALPVALLNSLAAFVVTILAWPFLWIDSFERMRLALFGRVLFDKYAHLSAPILERISNVFGQTIGHTDPLTVSLMAVGIFWAAARRHPAILWLVAGVSAGMLFVLPTALYLQHYWFYIVPFAQLLAAYPLMFLAARLRAPALAALAAATFAWSALYFPYPAMATIGCSNFECSVRRWGVSEPVYGLAEAAHWIRQHLSRSASIGTLVAPHVLQVQLPGYRVVDLRLPQDAAAQLEAVRSARIDYLLTNSWS
ncbi:MAG: glycosyltransferase family 39 protein, partial [Candidatus Eremiobacteraeota bacterium]|nr:glycosyltransferase family 39 protein [Candidatus Eremiobacteraeota bacterium]